MAGLGQIGAWDDRRPPPADLARALCCAEPPHGEHEKRTGVRDGNWLDWQGGKELLL